MGYIKVACHINKKDMENVNNFLFSNACLGTELIESEIKQTDNFGEIYTLNQADYPDTGVIIIGYFEDLIDPIYLKLQLEAFFLKNNIVIINHLFKIEQLEEVDYANSWKDNYHKIELTDKIVIIPSWFEEDKSKLNLKIEPGLGFGTGSHPTTFMCLKHLTNHLKENDTVCDLGCGSGIIALLAKKLGKGPVYGLDLDHDALKNARYNAKLNNLSEIIWTDKSLNQLNVKFDIIVANIVYQIIINLLPEIKNNLKNSGLLIISGITIAQKADLLKKLFENDFKLISIDEKQDFVSFVLRK